MIREIIVIAFIVMYVVLYIIWNKRSIVCNAKIIEKIHTEGVAGGVWMRGINAKNIGRSPMYTIIFEREDDRSHITIHVSKEIYDSLSVGNDGVLVLKHELFANLKFVKFSCNREPKNEKKYSKRFQRRI